MSMNSSRPYLIRALYEWIMDNDCTPHMLVNAREDEVEVPESFVKDGQIVLNVAPAAVQNLSLTNESVSFNARFAGQPHAVFVPVAAVLGIYAKENSQGMVFEAELPRPQPPDPEERKKKTDSESRRSGPGKPTLRVVK